MQESSLPMQCTPTDGSPISDHIETSDYDAQSSPDLEISPAYSTLHRPRDCLDSPKPGKQNDQASQTTTKLLDNNSLQLPTNDEDSDEGSDHEMQRPHTPLQLSDLNSPRRVKFALLTTLVDGFHGILATAFIVFAFLVFANNGKPIESSSLARSLLLAATYVTNPLRFLRNARWLTDLLRDQRYFQSFLLRLLAGL